MWLLIVAAILRVFDIAVHFWGADSRPGFSDGRTDVKETWSHTRPTAKACYFKSLDQITTEVG